jgi:MFS transporter, SP family, arabinose:H+ symporter
MPKLYLWSFSVALAGFLFGFDMIVISGAEQILQQLWESSDDFHGHVVIGAALWGTVVGAIGGGWPTQRYGRKRTLIGIGVLFLVSAVGAGLANGVWDFVFFRFIGGLGIGASTIAAPAYLSEIAPARVRGRLVAMYQLSIVLGILAAYLSNYFLNDTGLFAWRWMIGVGAFPALVYVILILFVPESPRWLVLKGRMQEAARVLHMVDPGADIDAFAQEVRGEAVTRRESIFDPRYRTALSLVFFIAFFNQFSGINAFLTYSPRIFADAGLADKAAFLSSVGIGVINVIFTLVGMAMIDRFGRKQLMYIGSGGYIVSLGMVVLALYLGWQGMALPLFFFLFIAAHAIGQGAVIWVFIAELFPMHLRAAGQAFGSSVHWVFAALIPASIPKLFTWFGPMAVFAFFMVMMIGQLAWVRWKMPETKGETLEALSARLKR